MRQENLSFRIVTKLNFTEAVTKSKEALKSEGFGVLTEIDITEVLKQKLELDFGRHYTILGACNPRLAYNAIEAELELGLFLPCNVIVYEDGDDIIVSAINPEQALNIINNPELKEIAQEAGTRLRRVVDAVQSSL